MEFLMSVVAFVVVFGGGMLAAAILLFPVYAFYKALKVADPFIPEQAQKSTLPDESKAKLVFQDWEGGGRLPHKVPTGQKSSDNARIMLFEWARYEKGDFVFDTDDYPLTTKLKK